MAISLAIMLSKETVEFPEAPEGLPGELAGLGASGLAGPLHVY